MIALDRPQWYDEDGQLRSSFSASDGLPVIETTISSPDDLPRDKSAIYYNPSGWTLTTPGMGPGTSKYITVLYSGVQYSYNNLDLVVQKAVVGNQSVGWCYEVQRKRVSGSGPTEFGPWETYVSSSIASAKDLLYEGPAVTVSTNTPAVGNAYSFPLANFNRSPVVGDKFPALVKSSTSNKLFSVICQVRNVSTSTVNATYTSVLQIASDYTNEILLGSSVSAAESIGQLSSKSGLYFGLVPGGSQCYAMIGNGAGSNIYGSVDPVGEVFSKIVTVNRFLNRQLLYSGTGPYTISNSSNTWVVSGDDVGASGLFLTTGNFSHPLVLESEHATLTCCCCVLYGTLGGYQYAFGFMEGATNNFVSTRFYDATITVKRGNTASLNIYSL